MSERLHKILAQHGLGSRREVERWIVEGRLLLNGKTAQIGDQYQQGDRVQLDGKDVSKRLQHTAAPQVMAYHKPQGQALDRERGANKDKDQDQDKAPDAAPEGETVQERLPVQRGVRWVPINPMHPGDSGLLLLTNDGALSYALTRHKKQIPAVYMVRVYVRGGVASAPVLPTTLRLDEETIEFTQVELSTSGGEGDSETDNVWYKVALARADKRAAVRALFVSHELTISRMMQVSFADIELTKDLPRGRHQFLKPIQVEMLYNVAQIKQPLNDGTIVRESYKPRPDKRTRLKQANREQAEPTRRSASGGEARSPSARHAVGKRSNSERQVPPTRGPSRGGTTRRGAGGSNRPSRPVKPSR
jgi:23S rRNA pseudouridine2605 synthase